EQLGRMLEANGALRRPLTDSDVLLLASPGAAHHAEQHLGMGPTLEAVTWLAGDMVRRLGPMDLLRPGVDPLRYQPGPLLRGADRLHALLGGTPPTFFTRLHEAVTARHLALWRQHVQKLNSELLERAPPVYTRLVLQELLQRTTVLDAGVRDRLREWQRIRA